MKSNYLSAAVVAALFAASSIVYAGDSKIDTVMKEAMKGDASLYKTVALGKGTDADAAKLLAYVKQLPAEKPPEGTAESWAKKTGDLVKAVEDVVAKKPDAIHVLQKAGNCKGCHTDHKKK